MKKNNRILDLQNSYAKGVRNVFLISAFIILMGNILDVIKFSEENRFITLLNFINIGIIIVSLILYYLKYISFRVSFSIVIYSIFLNMIVGKFFNAINLSDPMRVSFFLRDSLFVILLLTVASFSIHKINSFIIGGIYVIFSLFFANHVQNNFLNESIFLIVFIIAAYVGLTYYLVNIFEVALTDQHRKSQVIERQNESLSKINSKLEEQTKAIEAQSQRLKIQSDELKLKNTELAKLNKSKDLFFSIIAHDLKNPFNLIMGYSEMLLSKGETLSVEKRNIYSQAIRSASINIYYLLENLLSWTRSQSDKITLNKEKINLNNLVKEVAELYNGSLTEKYIDLEFKPENNYYIYADKDMIGTVVRNLISNAIKFTPRNGRIRIDLSEKNGMVDFSLTDNGLGIEGNVLNDILNTDIQTSTKGTDNEPGTGLGLKICKSFIERNNGILNISSVKNTGTTISFSCPKENPDSLMQ